MKAGLVREFSIWNQLVIGHSKRYTIPTQNFNQTTNKKDDHEKNWLIEDNDRKTEFPDLEKGEELKPNSLEKKKHHPATKCIQMMCIIFLLFCLNSCCFSSIPSMEPSISPTESHEVFEVLMPIPKFGTPVYELLLINHTFGNSWGHPAIETYIAPPKDLDFDKVVIQLNVTVSGVQYDRLAHLYLDGVALWRTSTAEPGGSTVYSTSSKDLSRYTKLFKKNGTDVMFQLDNLLDGRLNGEFAVRLFAYYYDTAGSTEVAQLSCSVESRDELASDESVKKLFATNRPADQIFPFVQQSGNRPPLIYLPSAAEYIIPALNSNTTRVKLNIFISGNAAEEFWYGNVLDQFSHKFDSSGRTLPKHGPCRIVNVFLDGEKVATAAPQPVIFTGGLSPALWNPIVSIGAFDLRSLEIELTPLLPLIWDGDKKLEIEVSNCLDEVNKNGKKSSIDQNWILAANILTWENKDIEASSGSILNKNDHSHATSFGISPPSSGKLTQIVDSAFNTSILSTLNYTLVNGSEVKVIAESKTNAKNSNVQHYTNFGDKQSIVSVSSSKYSFSLFDNSAEELGLISKLETTHTYPLVVQLNESPVKNGEVQYDVKLTTVKDTTVSIDHKQAIKLRTKQNGTSVYLISPNGNHGHGSTELKLKAKFSAPMPEIHYKRHVIAENGTVIKDETKSFELENVDSSPPWEIAIDNNYPITYSIQDHLSCLQAEGSIDKELSLDILRVLLTMFEDDSTIYGSEVERHEKWASIPAEMRTRRGLLQSHF